MANPYEVSPSCPSLVVNLSHSKLFLPFVTMLGNDTCFPLTWLVMHLSILFCFSALMIFLIFLVLRPGLSRETDSRYRAGAVEDLGKVEEAWG